MSNPHPRLSKTNIEYGDLGWNLYPGCLHKPAGICPVPHCWAEGMSKRQHQDFHKPHLIPELLLSPLNVKKPSVILVNFMGDLMGNWVDPGMVLERYDEHGFYTLRGQVFEVIKQCPQHQFLFLTKTPLNYKRWGQWPDNCWLGATVWNEESMIKALYSLTEGRPRLSVRLWLSVEPMLGPVVPGIWPAEWDEISWVVIGAQSNPVKYPKVDWVKHLVMECIKAKKPVWLKNNLVKALPPTIPFHVPPTTEGELPKCIEMPYRQEIPIHKEEQKNE